MNSLPDITNGAFAAFLATIEDVDRDLNGLHARLAEALHGLFGGEAALVYRFVRGPDGNVRVADMAVAGWPVTPEHGVDAMNEMLARLHGRYALFDPMDPPVLQRNRAVALQPLVSMLRRLADDPDECETLGIDPAVVPRALDAARESESIPVVGAMVASHMLRVLVCDDDRLLAWVGVVRASAFGPQDVAMLQLLLPSIRRRLRWRDHARLVTAQRELLAAAVDRLDTAAWLVDGQGSALHGNAYARSRDAADPDGTQSELERAVQGRGDARLDAVTAGRETGVGLALVTERRAESPVVAALPPRLRRVAESLLAGHDTSEIAHRTGLTYATVRTYIGQLLTRFQAHTTLELVARMHGAPPVTRDSSPPPGASGARKNPSGTASSPPAAMDEPD